LQKAIVWEENKIAIHREKCNLCGECENACPTSALTLFGKEYQASELVEELIVDKPFFDQSGGGVTLSGGECLAQPQFAIALTKALHERGIRVNIDTCGFVQTRIFEELLPFVDTFLYDIKAIDATLHKKLTGQDNDLILRNLTFLLENNAQVEIRFPLVVGLNDCETQKIGQFLSQFDNPPPVKVLKYHSLAGSRYLALGMQNTLPDCSTTLDEMERAVCILQAYKINAINGAKQS
jgi:pyruvate formate lyase activating enzyme